jgi:hypothetical protein
MQPSSTVCRLRCPLDREEVVAGLPVVEDVSEPHPVHEQTLGGERVEAALSAEEEKIVWIQPEMRVVSTASDRMRRVQVIGNPS